MDSLDRKIVQRSSQDYQLISLAYHESGHVICGLLNLLKITAVSVSPQDPKDRGATDFDNAVELALDDKRMNELLVLAEIKLYYAGLVSEKVYYKDICGSDRFPMMLKLGCSDDIEKAVALIKKHDLAPPGQARHKFKQKIMRDVRNALEEHWDAVKLISHALYAYKKLDYDDIRFLLIKKSKHKIFWKEQFRKIGLLFDTPKSLDTEGVRLILTG